MTTSAGTVYFQYISNRSQPFGPQVFFWLTSQGAGAPTRLQFITDYSQAGQIADWLGNALSGNSPAPLNLNLSAGSTLSFSSTATTATISGSSGSGVSLRGTFDVYSFGWMFIAVIFSINAMVQNRGDVLDNVENHPLARKVAGK